jgi:hypothetical protein
VTTLSPAAAAQPDRTVICWINTVRAALERDAVAGSAAVGMMQMQAILQGHPARPSCKAILQGHPARPSCKAILQGHPARLFARTIYIEVPVPRLNQSQCNQLVCSGPHQLFID